MPKISKIFLLFFILLNFFGWADIPPDPDKYHSYTQVVYIDNIKDYPNYKFIMLSGADIFGYPEMSIINESGELPSVPKWSDIDLAIVEKSLLDIDTPDDLANEIYSILQDRGFAEFPVKSAYLYIDNEYPVHRDEYHYKIVDIKDRNSTLKLYKRVIELLDGRIITEKFK